MSTSAVADEVAHYFNEMLIINDLKKITAKINIYRTAGGYHQLRSNYNTAMVLTPKSNVGL